MGDRFFDLRMSSTYQGEENKVDELNVEVLVDNKWETLDLSIRSPGFLQFVNALFSCQHLYMRTNCAERNLLLDSASGELHVQTDENWHIKNATIDFNAKLRLGSPT